MPRGQDHDRAEDRVPEEDLTQIASPLQYRIDPDRGLATLTIAARITFFATPLGLCGVAWTGRGIAGLQLPEPSATATRRRLRIRFPDAAESKAPPEIQDAVNGIGALLAGRPADLRHIVLDTNGVTEFDRRVYDITREIACGKTSSYGAVAARLGDPGASRAVGQALGRNPFPLIVPCHRVLSSDGSPGGFSAAGGATTKLRILAIEGAEAARQRGLFD